MRALAFILAGFAPVALGATFVVTTASDLSGNSCTATCSLRQAMNAANLTAAADTINFAIPTPARGTITLSPANPLPSINQPVTINGYSQGGALANTAATGSNARIRIRIDGSGLGPNLSALGVCVNDVTIRGLSITGFGGRGIDVGGIGDGTPCAVSPNATTIAGNFVGLQPSGIADGNAAGGVFVTRGTNIHIGGAALSDRNVISANGDVGIQLNSAGAGWQIDNNLVGTDPTGTLDRGNGGPGILIGSAAAGVVIGGLATNLVAFNEVGIAAAVTAGSGNDFRRNTIHSNGGLGIDLGENGITANDFNDADSGPNNLQNFPVLSAAARTQSGVSVEGSLDVSGLQSRTVEIAIHASASCDSSGNGEGERYLGSGAPSLSGQSQAFSFALATSDPLPPGTVLTATATPPDGSTSEFSLCFPLDPPPLVVTSTADPGDGVCNATCTLREAITAANARAADVASTIEFAIPGTGPFTISPSSALPTIERTMLIDGYSQPGASPNTAAEGSNAVIQVRIDGVAAGSVAGIAVCASGTVIRGVSLTRFGQQGAAIGARADGSLCTPPADVVLAGNFIGLAPDGSGAGNSFGGVSTPGGSNLRIGGPALADRNVVSDNGVAGLRFGNQSAGVRVDQNLIGTDPSGSGDRGNAGPGISVALAIAGMRVGDVAPNHIAFNRVGVAASGTGSGNAFARNRYFANDGLGIDLGTAGVTPNDAGDADAGANGLQNFPVIDLAQRSAAGIRIAGSLDVPPGTSGQPYLIAVYANSACDVSGNGEGERLLGTTEVTLGDGAGESFGFDLATADALDDPTAITTTATAPNGSTSEFSACVTASDPSPNLVVRSLLDTDGTTCGASCTLRQAINAANLQAGADQISFELPGTGPFAIDLLSRLPTITESVTIDGYTQVGASPNTMAQGSDAVILVEVTSTGSLQLGLEVCAPDVTIRGLALGRLSTPVSTTGNCGQAPTGFRVRGTFVGLHPDGSVAGAANSGVLLGAVATGTVIGGSAPADRNVIGGNGSGIGVLSSEVADVVVVGNYIGTDPAGLAPRPNVGSGINLRAGSQRITVGGDAPGEANRIAFTSSGDGIVVAQSAQANTLYANEFHDNAGEAIDIAEDGITPNDVDDADTGPNDRQNFPVLASVTAGVGSFTVQGALDVPAATNGASYRIALYESAACDTGGNGEGPIFLGSTVVTLGGGAESFSATLPVPAPAGGRVLTATATAPRGNTSEFSACLLLPLGDSIFGNGFE